MFSNRSEGIQSSSTSGRDRIAFLKVFRNGLISEPSLVLDNFSRIVSESKASSVSFPIIVRLDADSSSRIIRSFRGLRAGLILRSRSSSIGNLDIRVEYISGFDLRKTLIAPGRSMFSFLLESPMLESILGTSDSMFHEGSTRRSRSGSGLTRNLFSNSPESSTVIAEKTLESKSSSMPDLALM